MINKESHCMLYDNRLKNFEVSCKTVNEKVCLYYSNGTTQLVEAFV